MVESSGAIFKVFVGNPGVGKSTLCNGLGGEAIFPSGVSFATGKTSVLQKQLTKDGKTLLVDTPGLQDIEIRERAAKEIDKAFKEGGTFNTYFVITTEAARVRAADVATIKVVLNATKLKDDEYALIINKVTPGEMKKFQTEDGKQRLEKALFGGLPAKTKYIFFNPKDKNLEDEDDQVPVFSPEFKKFLDETAPKIKIEKPDNLKVGEWQQMCDDAKRRLDDIYKDDKKP